MEIGLFVTSARYLIRGAPVACLATLEPGTGNPYASMITVATETGGSPLFLISKLAWHTANIEADPRASILFMAGGEANDPLSLGRISLMGRAEQTDAPLDRERFLARHPEAAGYAAFADFALWRLRVEKAHYVGGFGRIGTLAGESVIRQGPAIDVWNTEISRILSTIDANAAARLAGEGLAPLAGEEGAWRVAACDPEGAELVRGGRAIRVVFPQPVEDVNQIPAVLQRLAAGDATSA